MTIYQPTIALKTFISGGVAYEDTYLDSNNNIAFLYDVYSVSQTVSNAISLWKNDNQFDITDGTPWLNILGQVSNRLLLNTYIETAVLKVPYVTSIISIDYTQDDARRTLFVTVKFNNTDKTVGVANANI